MAFLVETALGYLQKAHAVGRLGHAYLVTGNDRAQQEALALDLIALVNGERFATLEEAKISGVTLAGPESKSRRITVEQVRVLEKALYLGGGGAGAAGAGRKVAVITEADRLMQQAENAFLKTLEEPPPDTLLLLLTCFPEQLLDTILSRCIQVPLVGKARVSAAERSPEVQHLVTALAGVAPEQAGSVAAALLLKQAFAEALKKTKETVTKQSEADYKEEVAQYQKKTEGDWLKRREDVHKARAESIYLQQRAVLVGVLSDWLGDALRHQFSSNADGLAFPDYSAQTAVYAAALDERSLVQRIEAVEVLRRHLETNVQEALALEVGFLKIFG